MKKIGLVGYYSINSDLLNGQTIKSKLVRDALIDSIGNENVAICDYSAWRNKPFSSFVGLVKLINSCENIVILPARNAIKALAPLLAFIKKFKKIKLHYYVVGGWLIELLKVKPKLISHLKKFDYIYVELHTMQKELNEMGLTNIQYIEKFRDIKILNSNEINRSEKPPYRLVIFSRIMKEKGIAEAVEAVKFANKQLNSDVFTLDIYGQIYDGYDQWFSELMDTFPGTVTYKGFIDYKQSNAILKDYFALVFPTYYYGEGYPNTVVDAYAAGLPVIATRWNYNEEVIHDGRDGILYDTKDPQALTKILLAIAQDPGIILKMKTNALERAKNYLPEKAIKALTDNL